jgi:hypothetical protein
MYANHQLFARIADAIGFCDARLWSSGPLGDRPLPNPVRSRITWVWVGRLFMTWFLHRFLCLKGHDDFFDRFVDEARDLRQLVRFGCVLRFKFFFCFSQSKKGV